MNFVKAWVKIIRVSDASFAKMGLPLKSLPKCASPCAKLFYSLKLSLLQSLLVLVATYRNMSASIFGMNPLYFFLLLFFLSFYAKEIFELS